MRNLDEYMSNLEAPAQEATYDDVIAKLTEAKDAGTPVDEGIFTAIVGGIAGATLAPAVMRAVCKILGIDPKGQFGNLLTSRLILTALGAELGLQK